MMKLEGLFSKELWRTTESRLELVTMIELQENFKNMMRYSKTFAYESAVRIRAIANLLYTAEEIDYQTYLKLIKLSWLKD